jgi:hypothetical protein
VHTGRPDFVDLTTRVSHETVIAKRRFAGEQAVGDIIAETFRLSGKRVAITAAVRTDEPLTRAHCHLWQTGAKAANIA